MSHPAWSQTPDYEVAFRTTPCPGCSLLDWIRGGDKIGAKRSGLTYNLKWLVYNVPVRATCLVVSPQAAVYMEMLPDYDGTAARPAGSAFMWFGLAVYVDTRLEDGRGFLAERPDGPSLGQFELFESDRRVGSQ